MSVIDKLFSILILICACSCSSLNEINYSGEYYGSGHLILSPDSSMSLRHGRFPYGNGKWHDKGKYIILDFPRDTTNDTIKVALESLQCPKKYKACNIILIKKGKKRLQWEKATRFKKTD